MGAGGRLLTGKAFRPKVILVPNSQFTLTLRDVYELGKSKAWTQTLFENETKAPAPPPIRSRQEHGEQPTSELSDGK